MKHYYIIDQTVERGFIEVTESEFHALIGTTETAPYAGKLYRNEITAADVPDDIRTEVETIVQNRIASFGTYAERHITPNEFYNMIEEVL